MNTLLKNEVIGYPFVDHVNQENRPTIQNANEFLKSKYTKGCIFGREELQSTGTYKLMGYRYNFRDYLNRYIVKQYGQYHQVYAPNKTLLRQSTYGRIDEIIETKKK